MGEKLTLNSIWILPIPD